MITLRSSSDDVFEIEENVTIQSETIKFMIEDDCAGSDVFEIEENVAIQSETIKFMIEDDCAGSVIPLRSVNSKILSKVIEYCKKHVESTSSKSADKTADEELKAGDADLAKFNLTILSDLILSEELNKWDADFVKVDLTMLGDLMLAANFLNIKSLLNLLCKTVADMIKGKTPDEIRKTFNIENDFSPEEEEEACRENQWTFE